MEISNDLNRILEMSTEAERRRIAAQVLCAMLSNPGMANMQCKPDTYIEISVKVTDMFIAELNKNKDNV